MGVNGFGRKLTFCLQHESALGFPTRTIMTFINSQTHPHISNFTMQALVVLLLAL